MLKTTFIECLGARCYYFPQVCNATFPERTAAQESNHGRYQIIESRRITKHRRGREARDQDPKERKLTDLVVSVIVDGCALLDLLQPNDPRVSPRVLLAEAQHAAAQAQAGQENEDGLQEGRGAGRGGGRLN